MLRRTKIIATLGPACSDEATLQAMIQAGVDVLRVNFSHADASTLALVEKARSFARSINKPLGIMADLQGPKIRIGRLKGGEMQLHDGQLVSLSVAKKNPDDVISVTYPSLCDEIKAGDALLLDDGLIELQVLEIAHPFIHCMVVEGGLLRDNKGLNRKGGGLAARALTEKDLQDLKTAVDLNVDFVAISFVKDAYDIEFARSKLRELQAQNTFIVAKIERSEALGHLNEIIQASDAIMVARGDLAVEVGAAEVPGIQKRLIDETRRQHKIVITATQMMESMIHHPQPTRAEVSDVANAILDGTDAVMLSAETARGSYPVRVISMVDKVCQSAEKHTEHWFFHEGCSFSRPDEAIALAAMHAADHFPIRAIIALTESGASALWMSRHHSNVPIYAVTTNMQTINKLSIVQNVHAFLFDFHRLDSSAINQAILSFFKGLGLLHASGYILLTRGSEIGQAGGTNRLEILAVS